MLAAQDGARRSPPLATAGVGLIAGGLLLVALTLTGLTDSTVTEPALHRHRP